MEKRSVRVFAKPGPANTPRCIDAVREALGRDLLHVVVASTSGQTGLAFASALQGTGTHLVVITHSAGFQEPNAVELSAEAATAIREAGARVHTGTILTHSLEVAFNQRYGGIYPGMLIAQTLRVFGQGAKVACEITMQACDAGLIPEGEEVLAVGGTARGADTVLLVRSAASKRFFDLQVLEVLAKPRA